MTWQILIAISILTYSVSSIIQKILLRDEKIDPVAFSIVFQLLTGTLIGVFAVFTTGLSFPDLRPLILNLVIMTILYALGNIFSFKALQKIQASEFTVIFSSRALFTILASSILIKEGLNGVQLFGTILVLISIFLVSLKSTKIAISKYEFFAILAAIFFGFTTTNDRFLLGQIELYPYVFIAFVIPALFTIPLYPKSAVKIVAFLKIPLAVKMLALCLLFAVTAITFFMALQVGPNSSQIASLNLTSVIATVLLSFFVLKEKNNMFKKLLGSILAVIGIILLK